MKSFFVLLVLPVLFGSFCSYSGLAQGVPRQKSEKEIAEMTPAQRVRAYFDHGATAYLEETPMIRDYILRDGLKALPILTEIANRYHPEKVDNFWQLGQFEMAFFLANDIDNVAIRIRASEEGRAAIRIFEDVLNRMKISGYANTKHKSNELYLSYLESLRVLQGKELSITDQIIIDSLRTIHKVQISENEMLKFVNYLTLNDPTYPGRCKIKSVAQSTCSNSKDFYNALVDFRSR